jgi:uncharacterized protein YgiB involved in biofilm formation
MRSLERKSRTVRLVLMGAAVGGSSLLAGCGGEDVQRNSYKSQSDCVADYSDRECRPDYPVNGYTSHSALLYYGPWYHSNYRNGTRIAGDPGPGRFYSSTAAGSARGFSSNGVHSPIGTETGSRGGFGSHGRVSARGG